MSKLVAIRTELFEKFLKYVGCTEEGREHQVKRKGGHKKYNRSDLNRPIIIQAKAEVPVFIIKTNLRTLGMTTSDFQTILQQIK